MINEVNRIRNLFRMDFIVLLRDKDGYFKYIKFFMKPLLEINLKCSHNFFEKKEKTNYGSKRIWRSHWNFDDGLVAQG